MKALIIIPCYNEEGNIGKLLEELLNDHSQIDILVIDDGSKDRTVEVVQSFPKVALISLPFNMGIGGGVQAGYMWAAQHDYDVVVRMDGDGQHSPQDLESLLNSVVERQCDMGIGSRFISGKNTGYASSFFRRIGIYYLRFLIRFSTGKTIMDPTSGYIACNRKVIECFSRYYPYDYPEPEAILWMSQKKYLIQEIPVTMRKREAGVSSISLADTVYYLIKVSLSLLFLRRRF